MSQYFNPRSPRGGATKIDLTGYVTINSLFQSTLPTRGSDCISCCLACCIAISIHAPHEGERQTRQYLQILLMEFQSTLPTRGSDCDKKAGGDRPMNFNPRSPRGGATLNVGDKLICKAISIHAPHEGERRVRAAHSDSIRQDFNPRSPRGGATFNSAIRQRMWVISIHAPHEGERRCVCMVCVHVVDFNPRSPRGGATVRGMPLAKAAGFQSTLPTRGSDADLAGEGTCA